MAGAAMTFLRKLADSIAKEKVNGNHISNFTRLRFAQHEAFSRQRSSAAAGLTFQVRARAILELPFLIQLSNTGSLNCFRLFSPEAVHYETFLVPIPFLFFPLNSAVKNVEPKKLTFLSPSMLYTRHSMLPARCIEMLTEGVRFAQTKFGKCTNDENLLKLSFFFRYVIISGISLKRFYIARMIQVVSTGPRVFNVNLHRKHCDRKSEICVSSINLFLLIHCAE